MNIKHKIITIFTVLTAFTIITSGEVSAHDLFTRDDLAHSFAVRFNLNETDVRNHLATYKSGHPYYCDDNQNTSISKDTQSEFRKDHLTFIESKLNHGVANKRLSHDQKDAVMLKLKEMMDRGPSYSSYSKMNNDDRQDEINKWIKEMKSWSRSRGLNLDLIRNLTGKGNKYLMGMNL